MPDGPASPAILARLVGRTGPWNATLGTANDAGDLTIRYRCTGGGTLTVSVSPGATARNACDGATKSLGGSGDASPGPVTVDVRPDGDQLWWLQVARGPVEPADAWPDAPGAAGTTPAG